MVVSVRENEAVTAGGKAGGKAGGRKHYWWVLWRDHGADEIGFLRSSGGCLLSLGSAFAVLREVALVRVGWSYVNSEVVVDFI